MGDKPSLDHFIRTMKCALRKTVDTFAKQIKKERNTMYGKHFILTGTVWPIINKKTSQNTYFSDNNVHYRHSSLTD